MHGLTSLDNQHTAEQAGADGYPVCLRSSFHSPRLFCKLQIERRKGSKIICFCCIQVQGTKAHMSEAAADDLAADAALEGLMSGQNKAGFAIQRASRWSTHTLLCILCDKQIGFVHQKMRCAAGWAITVWCKASGDDVTISAALTRSP